MKEKTLTIIKPDSVRKKCFGSILRMLLEEGFEILNLKWIKLTKEQAESFYDIHRDKPFFGELVSFMTSGPVIVAALEREDAVLRLRKVMGPTDPKKAGASTIRANFGDNVQNNAIHGSDSIENAKREIGFFFAEYELGRSSPEEIEALRDEALPSSIVSRPSRKSI